MTSREERLTPVVTADHTERAAQEIRGLLRFARVDLGMVEEDEATGSAALDALVAALAAAEQRAKDEHASFDIATSHYRDEFMRAETAEARADALARRNKTLETALRHIDAVAEMEPKHCAPKIRRAVAAALAGEEGADE